MSDSAPPPGFLLLGEIGRSIGLDGAVRLHPRHDEAPSALEALDEVFVEGLGATTVEELRPHGRWWLLRLGRVRRVERARELAHARVWGERERLDGELVARLRRADPSGLPVLVDGRPWGEVLAREGDEPHPWLRVRGPAGEVLLPARAPYVRTEANEVRVDDPPPGLLDDAS